VFENAGLTTITLALVREHAEKVKPPRALFVPFYFGHTLGRPNDPELQHRVISEALEMLKFSQGPVLAEFQEEAGPTNVPQASAAQLSTNGQRDNPANELTALRPFYERWLAANDGRTAVGLSGIPQRRFRGVVRFLEAFSADETADMEERPPSVSLPQFIRYCVDDLKAFYFEARIVQSPDADEPEVHEWFWGATAAGKLVASVADRMGEMESPEHKSISYGIVR
jgi:hypothetical protein